MKPTRIRSQEAYARACRVIPDGVNSPARAFGAVAAYEPPMPWLGFRREGRVDRSGRDTGNDWRAIADDPGVEAQRFFSRMVSPDAWARLTEADRDSRRADGPALVADLRGIRGEGPPFDVGRLSVPAVFGMGGRDTAPHHRRNVLWLGANVPTAVVFEIEGAHHGAHLSHPDHFAAMTRLVVEKAAGPN